MGNHCANCITSRSPGPHLQGQAVLSGLTLHGAEGSLLQASCLGSALRGWTCLIAAQMGSICLHESPHVKSMPLQTADAKKLSICWPRRQHWHTCMSLGHPVLCCSKMHIQPVAVVLQVARSRCHRTRSHCLINAACAAHPGSAMRPLSAAASVPAEHPPPRSRCCPAESVHCHAELPWLQQGRWWFMQCSGEPWCPACANSWA